jgi:hypothetical protein
MLGMGRDIRAVEVACQTFFRGVGSGWAVGRKLPTLEGLRPLDEFEELLGVEQPGHGVLWRVDRGLRAGVAGLRSKLLPGAHVFFVVELVPSVWGVARELLGGRNVLRFSREEVCEEVLLAGLLEPRVWVDTPHLLGLSARLPFELHALDRAFFATSVR